MCGYPHHCHGERSYCAATAAGVGSLWVRGTHVRVLGQSFAGPSSVHGGRAALVATCRKPLDHLQTGVRTVSTFVSSEKEMLVLSVSRGARGLVRDWPDVEGVGVELEAAKEWTSSQTAK